VDPRNGAQSVVTNGDKLCYPFGVALEANGRILVTDFGDFMDPQGTQESVDCPIDAGLVIRVDPGTGAQTILSANQPGNSLLRGPFGLAVEPDGGILVVSQTSAAAAVAAIDPVGGRQTVVTPNSSRDDAFELPQRVAVAPDGDLVVADYALNDREGGLVGVDRSSGAAGILRQGELFNNPLGIALVVNRPPSATLALSAGKVAGGEAVSFDASGSGDPESLPLRYDWDLDGNGMFETMAGGDPVVSRIFESSTTVTPRVRVSDPHGGQALAVAAEGLMVDAIRPVLSRFGSSSRRLAVPTPAGRTAAADRRGRASARARRAARAIRFRFRLSEPARVSISIRRALRGRLVRGRCLAPGNVRKRARPCTRWRRAVTLRRSAGAGPNSVRFSAMDRRPRLKPGRYRAVALATDDVGNSSEVRWIGLRVLSARR
jgi:PKD domain